MHKNFAAVTPTATACQQQSQAPTKPAEATFDGAQVTDAAAVRARGSG